MFKALNETERKRMASVLRDNAENGVAILMGETTEFKGTGEFTDQEVISAIRSVPCHY